LKGDAADFKPHGRHTSVYPMQLPVWLPVEVMRQMVNRFKKFLCDELIIMVMKEAKATERVEGPTNHAPAQLPLNEVIPVSATAATPATLVASTSHRNGRRTVSGSNSVVTIFLIV
jgi:hypothetical protein